MDKEELLENVDDVLGDAVNVGTYCDGDIHAIRIELESYVDRLHDLLIDLEEYSMEE